MSRLHLDAGQWARNQETSRAVRSLFSRRNRHPTTDDSWQSAQAQDGLSLMFEADFRY